MLTSVLGNKTLLTGGALICAVIFSSVLCTRNSKNRALEKRWEKEYKIFSERIEKENQEILMEFSKDFS